MNKLFFEVLANCKNVSLSRAILIGFLVELDIPLSVVNELKTSLSEAVTNAIVHGYNEDGKSLVKVILEYDDNYITMTVIDNGVGIKDIEKAKEPLYTTKKDTERAGLGFTIMEVFSDNLTINSQENIGTTVIMRKCYKN